MIIPSRLYGFRWMVIGWAVTTFFWLSREDSDVLTVIVLGMIGAFLFCSSWITRNLGGKHFTLRQFTLICTLSGSVTGVSTSLFTAGLMFFKNVRHAHLFPDYPFALIGAILQRVLVWGLAGMLLGLATAFLWIALRPHHPLQSEVLIHSETAEPPT